MFWQTPDIQTTLVTFTMAQVHKKAKKKHNKLYGIS